MLQSIITEPFDSRARSEASGVCCLLLFVSAMLKGFHHVLAAPDTTGKSHGWIFRPLTVAGYIDLPRRLFGQPADMQEFSRPHQCMLTLRSTRRRP